MTNTLKEDLKFNIERANEIVRLIEKRRNRYLELNLALMTVYSLVWKFLLESESISQDGKNSFTFFICVYFGITLINIIYNLIRNKTKGTQKALCYYGKWKKGDLNQFDFNSYNYKDDCETQIKNLHKYQENYATITAWTRRITFIGLLALAYGLLGSIIINAVDPQWISISINIIYWVVPVVAVLIAITYKIVLFLKNGEKEN